MSKRKGQEEIVGFVLIVVLVAIVLVIFLGIQLRKAEPSQRDSEILYQFLESSMEQTTDCSLSSTSSRLSLDDALRECYSVNNTCTSGMSTCQTTVDTFKAILNNTWAIGPAYPYKGYELMAEYSTNASGQAGSEEIFSLSNGNCSDSYIGNSYWIPEYPGNIIVKMKLCSS